MATTDSNFTEKSRANVSSAFNYSYVVLVILLLLTIGATSAFFEISTTLGQRVGTSLDTRRFPDRFLCELVIFGATYREIQARAVLQQKTIDLIERKRRTTNSSLPNRLRG